MTVTDVAHAMYLAGDFSGIQRFVLRVKTAGKAQAKRLRARSFLLDLLEHAALSIVQRRFAVGCGSSWSAAESVSAAARQEAIGSVTAW